jgi:hypothetical protein
MKRTEKYSPVIWAFVMPESLALAAGHGGLKKLQILCPLLPPGVHE